MHVDNQSNVLNRTYTYSSTQNDGRIETMVDAVSGETVQYQYDSLKRLISAETTGTQWGQSFSYDGFGNMLSTVRTKGSATEFFLYPNPANNRLGGGHVYDDNGNLIQTPQSAMTMTYDVENRMVSVTRSGNGTEYYAYGPSNERVWKREEFTGGIGYNFFYFYGVDGALLTTNSIDDDWDYNVYFAGRTVWRESVYGNSTMPPMSVSPDRLGSNVKHFPFGDEPTSTTQNREKFATYFRDEVSTLDYARNRYYSSTIARFTTADPYGPSARPGAPQTWNRYSYVGGDPVNRNDPSGLDIYADWLFLLQPGGLGPTPTTSIDVVASPLVTAYFAIDMLPLFNYFSESMGWWLGAFKDSLAGAQEGNAGTPAYPPGYFVPPALRPIVADAVSRAAQRLNESDCRSLFGGESGSPSDALNALWNNNGIVVGMFGSGIAPGIGAYRDGGNIVIAQNRYFFSGLTDLLAPSYSWYPGMPFPPNIVLAATLTIQFGGLTNSEIQESILIHEMLHYMGIAGPDSAGQMNVLGNGQVVYGSTGISLAVREHCFK